MSTFQGRDSHPGFSELFEKQRRVTETYASKLVPPRALTDEEVESTIMPNFRYWVGIKLQRAASVELDDEFRKSSVELVIANVALKVNAQLSVIGTTEAEVPRLADVISIFRNIDPGVVQEQVEPLQDVG